MIDRKVIVTEDLSRNLIELILKNPQLLACCPTRNEPAVGDNIRQFPVPDSTAIWWRCSVCAGWHIMMIATDNDL